MTVAVLTREFHGPEWLWWVQLGAAVGVLVFICYLFLTIDRKRRR